jgi:hypothetical protein
LYIERQLFISRRGKFLSINSICGRLLLSQSISRMVVDKDFTAPIWRAVERSNTKCSLQLQKVTCFFYGAVQLQAKFFLLG